MSENQEDRIKRLERAVRGLTIAFIISIGFSIYAFFQIKAMASSIPSYHELKEDVQTLKKFYDASPILKEKAEQGYNYTKDKVVDGYEYSKDKVVDGYNYTKEKTGDMIDYITGDDEEPKKEEKKK